MLSNLRSAETFLLPFEGHNFKLFMGVKMLYRNRVDCLSLPITSNLVEYLRAKVEPTEVEQLQGRMLHQILD